ncbi:MAG: hypothetical protein OCD00_00650 [Colwellia sp.]
MSKLQILILLITLFYITYSYALSPDAIEGKSLYPMCNACHSQANNPLLAPPMWEVQRRYKKNSRSDKDFVKTMVSFIKAPTREKAIHNQALSQLGLMPPMPLPDEMLTKIVTYIVEENFSPPCQQWQMAIKRAKEKGEINDTNKEQKQFERFCR